MFFGRYLRLRAARLLGCADCIAGNIAEKPPLSFESPHFCSNNMENPGERRKTTEEMGQGRAVSSPPLLQINNIAREATRSDGKQRGSIAYGRSSAEKRILVRSWV